MGVKKGLNEFKDLGRLLGKISFIIFYTVINNKEFIIIHETLINLKANNDLFIGKFFI